MRKELLAILFFGIFSMLSPGLFAQLTFNVESATVRCDDTNLIPVEITVENFNNIGNFQFGIVWDTAVIQFDQVTHQLPPSTLFIQDDVENGELRAGWADFNPPFTGESFMDGTAIITLFFNKVGNGGTSSSVNITSLPGLTFQVADGNGVKIPINQVTVNQGSVAIFDSIDPTITNCPTDVNVSVGNSASSGVATWVPPTANDDCAVETFTSSADSGDSFPVGTTTVNYVATDFGGNTANCSFDVTVTQTAVPGAPRFELEQATLDCSEDSVIFDLKVFNFENLSSFQFGLQWDTTIVKYKRHLNFLPSTATFFEAHPDSTNIGVRWVDFNFPIGEDIPDNTTVLSLVFDLTGLGGDSTAVDFTNLPSFPIEVTENSVPLSTADYQLVNGKIKLSDTESPIVNCPNDTMILVPTGTMMQAVNYTTPVPMDNCNVASFSESHNSGDEFPVGTTTVTYSATDNAGNNTSCDFDINIVESQAAGLPTFTLEQKDIECKPDSVTVDIVVNNFENLSSFQFNVAWDTSVIKYRRHLNFLPAAGTFFEQHPDSANIAIRWADFNFPIGEDIPDNTVIVSLVFDLTGGINSSSLINFESATGFPIEVTRGSVPLPPTEYSLVDGNVSIADDEKPAIADCPTNRTVTALAGASDIAVSWTPPTATDNCNLVSFDSNFNPNDNFPIGTTTVEYVGLDEAGNSDTCRFDIVVEQQMSPQPTFETCPGDASIPVTAGSCNAIHTWTEPTLSTMAGLDSLTNSHDSGDTFSLGATTVVYIAYSAQGNDTCQFVVTVFDNENPVINDCPSDINISVPQGTMQATATWTPPTANDNCNIASLSSNFNSGDDFPVGMTTVEYVALDDANNSDTCRFNVNVVENNAPQPMFNSCPIDTTLSADTLQCTTTYSWVEPTLNSTTALDSLVNSHDSGDTFAVGTTEVSYIAYSSQGNDTCRFNITVRDDEMPIVNNCPKDTSIFVDPAICKGVVNWSPTPATDNCGIGSFLQTHQPDYEFPIGSLDVLLIATDLSGNAAVCNFTVTVIDTIKPFFPTCGADVEVLVDGSIVSDPDGQILFGSTDDCMGTRLFFAPPFARDSCSFVNTTQVDGTNLTSGSTFPIGTHQLEFEAIDNAGNMAECSFSITVHPIPTLNAEANSGNVICEGEDIELVAFMPSGGFTYLWSGPNNYTSSNAIDTIFNATTAASGTYTVTATSAAGCESKTDLVVTVNSQPDVLIDHNDVLCADGSSDLNLSATDNANAVTTWNWSGPQMFTSDLASPTIMSVGANEAGIYTVVGTTAAGCSDTAQVDIQISTAPVMPTIMATNNDMELCVGESTTITGTLFTGNNPVHTWQVSPSTGFTFNETAPNERIYSFDTPGSYRLTYSGEVNGCSSDTAFIMINVTAAPQLALTSNGTFLCSDGMQTLELSETIGDATSYSWTGPDNFASVLKSPSIQNVTVENAGFYVLTAIAGDGCTSRDSIEVEVSLGPNPMMPTIIPTDTSICLGSSIELSGQSYTHPNGVTYQWFQKLELSGNILGISNNQIVIVEPTRTGVIEYLYVVEVGDCATDTAKVTITVTEGPTIALEYNDPLMCITDDADLELSEMGGSAATWNWSGPLSFTSDLQNPVITDITKDNAGTYEVTITDVNGCSSTDSIEVMISQGVEPLTVTVNNANPCEDLDSLILSTTLIPGAIYNWSGPTTINSTSNTVIVPFPTDEDSGEYMVEVTTAGGCTSGMSDPMMVDVLTAPKAVMDYVLVLYETPIEINVLGNDTFNLTRPLTISTISQPFKGVLENRKDGTFLYTPNEKQLDQDFFTYQICYEECPMLCAEAVVTFDIKHDPNQCVIPTVITPNNDGRNDLLEISCIEAGTFPDNELIIFNEWGDQVHKSAPYNNDWGGTYKGQPLPDGTYYYLFFRNGNAQPQKGFVTLFR